MLSRHVGRMLRGEATPGQVVAACTLGGLLGFLPGFADAPGAWVALVALVLLLQVSLPVVLLVAAASRLLSLALLPASFAVGRVLLDGPTQPLFRAAINAPGLALFGLERYTTSGGLALGLLVGLASGVALVRALARLRAALAGLDSASPKYHALADRPSARVLGWLLLGARDLHWGQPPARRLGPVRMAGLVVVLLLGGLAGVLHQALTGPWLASALRSGLVRANGATVDLAHASLDLAEGRLVLEGLALADPNALDHDLLRAARLTADVDASDLLRRRLALDEVVVSDAVHGAPRATPGARAPGWEPPPAPAPDGTSRTLEDYVREAQAWKERLSQVRRWLEALAGPPEPEPAAGGPTLEEQLEERARQFGRRGVVASHLIEGAPSFLVRDLRIEGLTSAGLPGEVLDLTGANLSTQPALLPEPAHLRLATRSGLLLAEVGVAGGTTAAGGNALLLQLRGWPVERCASALAVDGQPPLQGGTLDLTLQGAWAGGRAGWLDLPLQIALHDTTLSLGGRSQRVSQLRLAIGLRGPLDDPALTLDDDQLVQALKDAGAAELSARVDQERAALEQKAADKLDEAVKDKLGGALGGLFGGDKDEDEPRPEGSSGKKKGGG
ncbi:MAG: hypothetical protein FJ296_06015 [Planctomycetes bacterium]|nr:hypothetical protein [Planctomycetota bacterium]